MARKTDRDAREFVKRAITESGESPADFDVEGIADSVRAETGSWDMDKASPEAFWDAVSRNAK
jgi:hypothetical protein